MNDLPPSSQLPPDDVPEQVQIRRDKRDRLLAGGVEPYPVGFPRTHTVAEVRQKYGELGPDTRTGDRVGITGRVMLNRIGGKLSFATLRDGATDIQVMLSLDTLGEQSLADWKLNVDLGDLIGVQGEVITSRRGELSVLADRWEITAKCLRPLPEKHKGLTDPEARVRQRYLDLIVNTEARQALIQRSELVSALRDSCHRRGFIEVETPMLQTLHGGATARPFITHINTYHLDLYLRIAPELFLKRLLVGGIEKVFEINRNFRNEGVDATHNPEFTMLEAYQAYGDYNTMAAFTRELVQEAAERLFGRQVVRHFDGTEHDFSGEWASITMYGSVSAAVGAEITPDTPYERLVHFATAHGIELDPTWGPGRLVEELFEVEVAPRLQAPTFVRDFPAETTPLTRAHREIPGLTEKWDLYFRGVELATAYSELADPVEQRERFVAQSLLTAQGDPEAMHLDEDFLRALEYGMPPAGGMGMGIDRLLMALTGLSTVRETIPFPLVKPASSGRPGSRSDESTDGEPE
ncbi:MAG: bifunctional lysylphosphatidylglycerol synthetase/lysine--tRNA ligase LysX [Sporichthyaceae bacterium]|nr:bifunctional lysylphosphatidylglycerol synthetase/lysine--tRNA ligase LysX [Sporichthyaceae bacterium]